MMVSNSVTEAHKTAGARMASFRPVHSGLLHYSPIVLVVVLIWVGQTRSIERGTH